MLQISGGSKKKLEDAQIYLERHEFEPPGPWTIGKKSRTCKVRADDEFKKRHIFIDGPTTREQRSSQEFNRIYGRLQVEAIFEELKNFEFLNLECNRGNWGQESAVMYLVLLS